MPIMATHGGSRVDRLGSSSQQKSCLASPEKVRELLNEGVSSTDVGSDRCRFQTMARFLFANYKLGLASLVSFLARLQYLCGRFQSETCEPATRGVHAQHCVSIAVIIALMCWTRISNGSCYIVTTAC